MTALPASPASAFETPEYRVEGELKVRGRDRYTADSQLPGTLVAGYLKSPLPHARIVSVDTSAARAVPGVHAVLTSQDIGPRRYGKVWMDLATLLLEAESPVSCSSFGERRTFTNNC